MIHEIKAQKPVFDRVATEEQRAIICKHDRDFQTGDTLHMVRVSSYGNRTSTLVERWPDGRFRNEYVDDAPVELLVTHVLPGSMVDGLVDGVALLSVEVAS